MNEALVDLTNPALFRTDEKMTPRPTIPRKYLSAKTTSSPLSSPTSSSSAAKNKTTFSSVLDSRKEETAEEAEAREQREQQDAEEKELSKIKKQNESRLKLRQTQNINHQLGSLTSRFVRARLLHLKLHLLQKLGCFVSDQELTTSDEMMFGVEEEASSMGEMVPTDIGAIDESFASLTANLSSRLDDEKSKSGSFAAGTWYGALCQQVDDHAKLLVDFRTLQKQNESLGSECDELKARIERQAVEQQVDTARRLHEQQSARTKSDLSGPHARTQKLTLELAMRDAEKRSSSGNHSNNDDGGASSSFNDPGQADVAKSLRLQDEVTVLRKSSHTLQLALSRVQHRYNLLLQEHEGLKTEIRGVIAQQDAEESDIRRIFMERERDYDVVSRRCQQLEKELMSTARKLDLAKSSRSMMMNNNKNEIKHDPNEKSLLESVREKMAMSKLNQKQEQEEDNEEHSYHHNKQKKSLADRMKKLRSNTTGKMQVAFSETKEAITGNADDLAKQQQDELRRKRKQIEDNMGVGHLVEDEEDDKHHHEFGGSVDDESSVVDDDEDDDDRIFSEQIPDGHFDDQKQKIKKPKSSKTKNLIPHQVEAPSSSDEEDDDLRQKKQELLELQRRISNASGGRRRSSGRTREMSTMTEPPKKSQTAVTVGTQTFFRNAAGGSLMSLMKNAGNNNSNTSDGGSHKSALERHLQQSLDEQIRKNQEQEKQMIDMEMKLDKVCRAVNKQCNVVEKFLEENLEEKKNHNVIFLKQDLQRMLKRFGVPLVVVTKSATESNSNNMDTKEKDINNNKTTGHLNNNKHASSSSWQQTLFRCPVFSSSPLLDPTTQDEVKLEKVLEKIDDALLEQQRLDRLSDQGCQTDDVVMMNNNNGMISPNTVIHDVENTENDPLLKHLRKPNGNNTSNNSTTAFDRSSFTMPSFSTNRTNNLHHQPSSAFWDATEAVNALKSVYVDAGRLMDSVETESEEMTRMFNNSSDNTMKEDPSTETNNISATSSTAAFRHLNKQQLQQKLEQEQREKQGQKLKHQEEVFEKIATDQFFAIRSLENSCRLLAQRLSGAKEDYVKRFYDKSSLLNQTLGNVSKTHPREANKLSRLAKTVQQARSAAPWIQGMVSSSAQQIDHAHQQTQQHLQQFSPTPFPHHHHQNTSSSSSAMMNNADASSSSLKTANSFHQQHHHHKASEIVMGSRPATASLSAASSSSVFGNNNNNSRSNKTLNALQNASAIMNQIQHQQSK